MDYRILGPLEVRDDGHALELGGEKQRALLAILLLHANEAVSVGPADRRAFGASGRRASAHKTLQGYVYRLRKLLENGEPRSCGQPSTAVYWPRARTVTCCGLSRRRA